MSTTKNFVSCPPMAHPLRCMRRMRDIK
jgi:hypothetical protein